MHKLQVLSNRNNPNHSMNPQKQEQDDNINYKFSQSGRLTIFTPSTREQRLPTLRQVEEEGKASARDDSGTAETLPLSPDISPKASLELNHNHGLQDSDIDDSDFEDEEEEEDETAQMSASGTVPISLISKGKKTKGKKSKRKGSSKTNNQESSAADGEGLGNFLATKQPQEASLRVDGDEKSMWETIADDAEFAKSVAEALSGSGINLQNDAEEAEDILSDTEGEPIGDLPDNPVAGMDATTGTNVPPPSNKNISKSGEESMVFDDIFVGSDEDYDEKDIEADIMDTTPPPTPPPAPKQRNFTREESLRMGDLFDTLGKGSTHTNTSNNTPIPKSTKIYEDEVSISIIPEEEPETLSPAKKKKSSNKSKKKDKKDASFTSTHTSPRKKHGSSSRRSSSAASGGIDEPPLFIELDTSSQNFKKGDSSSKKSLSPRRTKSRSKSKDRRTRSASPGPRPAKSRSPSRRKSRSSCGDFGSPVKSPSRRKSRTLNGSGDFEKASRRKSTGGALHASSPGNKSRRKTRTSSGSLVDAALNNSDSKSRRKSRTTGAEKEDSKSRRKSRTTGGEDHGDSKNSTKSPSKRRSRSVDKEELTGVDNLRSPLGESMGSPSWGAVVRAVADEDKAAREFAQGTLNQPRLHDSNGVIQPPGATTAEHDRQLQPAGEADESFIVVEEQVIIVQEEEEPQPTPDDAKPCSSSKSTRPGLGAKILSMASLKEAKKSSDPHAVVPTVKILVLISSRNPNRAVKFHQRWAFTILDSFMMDYYVMDADDPEQAELVEHVLGVSELKGVFPQFFCSNADAQNPEFRFKGNWSWLDATHEEGKLPEALFS